MARSLLGKTDILYGAITALVAAGMIVHTYDDRYVSEFLFGDVSTVFVPRLLLGAIVILALFLVLKGLRDREGVSLPAVQIGRVMAVFAAIVATIAGVWFIGYLIAMPVGVFVIGWAIGYPNKLILAVTAVVAPMLTWFVLGQFAQVSFPPGALF